MGTGLTSLLCFSLFWREGRQQLALTPTHLAGQLVVHQELGHVCVWVLAQDGIHSLPVLIQPEVEVTKPENFIEPSGDITCKFKQECSRDAAECVQGTARNSFLSLPADVILSMFSTCDHH